MIVLALLGVAIQNRAVGRSLVLTGVIAYTDPTQGFAIIGSSVQDTYVARPGQRLPDGSRIREIHPKHVVLEYGGSLETLGMYTRGQPAGSGYAPIPAPAPAVPSMPPPIIPPPPPQTRQEEAEWEGAIPGEMRPGPTRPADVVPGQPRPGEAGRAETPRNDLRPNDLPRNDAPRNDMPPGDALPKQAQPEPPLPTAQDPADESRDDRRQRAESRKK